MRLKTIPIFLTFLVMGVARRNGTNGKAQLKNYELKCSNGNITTFFVFIAFCGF